MDPSSLAGSRRAVEWWRATGDSTKVQWCANNTTLYFLASILATLRRRFLWNHVLTMQTIPSCITTELPCAGHSWLSPSRFILFLLLRDCHGRILYFISSSQCVCGKSTFTIPFGFGWDPGRCIFTSTFSVGTEELSPCHHIFQGQTAACKDLEKEETENFKNILKSRFVGSQASRTHGY